MCSNIEFKFEIIQIRKLLVISASQIPPKVFLRKKDFLEGRQCSQSTFLMLLVYQCSKRCVTPNSKSKFWKIQLDLRLSMTFKSTNPPMAHLIRNPNFLILVKILIKLILNFDSMFLVIRKISSLPHIIIGHSVLNSAIPDKFPNNPSCMPSFGRKY